LKAFQYDLSHWFVKVIIAIEDRAAAVAIATTPSSVTPSRAVESAVRAEVVQGIEHEAGVLML
jgi:hypothetical protein